MDQVSESDWKWFGHSAHLIVGHDCRFHLATLIGDFMVSTVGEYLPDSVVRESLAASRNITLTGQGDARRADYMKKIGYETIGLDRKYETMVFRVTGETCKAADCACGLPTIDGNELDFAGYNAAGDATRGHYSICRKVSRGDIS